MEENKTICIKNSKVLSRPDPVSESSELVLVCLIK